MLILGAHPLRQIEQRTEASFQRRIAINLAADVADDPAKPRPQELELAPGALELVGVGIAADHVALPNQTSLICDWISPIQRTRPQEDRTALVTLLRSRLFGISRNGMLPFCSAKGT